LLVILPELITPTQTYSKWDSIFWQLTQVDCRGHQVKLSWMQSATKTTVRSENLSTQNWVPGEMKRGITK